MQSDAVAMESWAAEREVIFMVILILFQRFKFALRGYYKDNIRNTNKSSVDRTMQCFLLLRFLFQKNEHI